MVPGRPDSAVTENLSAGSSAFAPYQLDELMNAVHFAETRCLSSVALIHRACDVTDHDHGAVIRVLQERKLSTTEQQLLEASILTAISDDARTGLPAHLRPATDRLASNLGQLLPSARARQLASHLVQHRLRARRRAATKLLRRVGVTSDEVAALRVAVLTYYDSDALELLARIPNSFGQGDCCRLLGLVHINQLDRTFLTAMVITRLWNDGELDHQHAAAVHTLAYVRAMGRTGDTSQIDRLIGIITASLDRDLISMCASVAGRLRSELAVHALERRINELALIGYSEGPER